jgi:S-adenosylmethionine hydrolase
VGPDNGLLWPAIERLGGATAAVDVSRSALRSEPVSATFHGRDVFAPVAAHLARGMPVSEAGDEVAVESLVTLAASEPLIEAGRVVAQVAWADRFGNAALGLAERHLAASGLRVGGWVAVEVGGRTHRAAFARTFGDVKAGELILYVDSTDSLALAVNGASAAAKLGIAPGDQVVLRPIPE